MAVAVHPHPDPHPQHAASAAEDAPLAARDAVCYDDMLRLTPVASPTPGLDLEPAYRCPVSTPANFVPPSPRIRRTKPMPVSLEISLTPRSQGRRSAGSKPTRPGAATRRSSSQHGAGSQAGGGGPPVKGPGRSTSEATGRRAGAGVVNWRSLDYYYVDKAEEEREAAETNTFWLKALCAQPVHEILDKYRRRSEFRRSRFLWSKTYTTPGERSLLMAWQRNAPRVLRPAPRGCLASPSPSPSQPQARSRSHSQSLGGYSPSKAASRSSVPASLRRFHGEPPTRSMGSPRGYASEEDEEEDDTVDGATEVGESMASGDLSVSTPRYSQSKHSPLQRSASGSGVRAVSPKGQMVHGYPGGTATGNHHPIQPLYDISDHFQVCLPSVRDSQLLKQRQGTGQQRKGKGPQRQGTPKARTTIPPLAHNRRQRLRDVRPEALPSKVGEVSQESNVSRGDVSNGTTQPATPRSTTLESSLPAIGRA